MKKIKRFISHHISIQAFSVDISLGFNVVYGPYKPRRLAIYITLFKCVIKINLGKDTFVR